MCDTNMLELSQAFLRHLQAESAFLEHILNQQRLFQACLSTPDASQWQEALRLGESMRADSDAMRRKRAEWFERVTTTLGATGDPSVLERFVDRLPATLSQPIHQLRQSIRKQVAEWNRVRNNTLLYLQTSIHYYRQFFRELTGSSEETMGYGRRGTYETNAGSGRLIEIQG